MSVDSTILFSVLIALLIVRALRRFLDLPNRLPRWNERLSQVWAPGVILYVLALMFSWKSDQLDEIYLLFVSAVFVLVLLRLQSYRPARTLVLALCLTCCTGLLSWSWSWRTAFGCRNTMMPSTRRGGLP